MAYTIDVHLSPEEVRSQMLADALKGLQGEEKSIPPVWFYDERGSRLFEEITQLPEYYPTRAERALLEAHAASIAELSKADTLVELGAGACEKTRVLLSALQEAGTLSRYVPFDVSDEFLRSAAATLSEEFDSLDIHLVIGDFHHHLAEIPTEGRRMIAFLGGTIGNLNPAQRARFLFDLNCTMSSDDSLLLGTDLVKDRSRLVAAYDDAAGVTADFNRNVLHVLNEQLGGDFDPELFRHVALWNEDEQWIEMRLRADEANEVALTGAGITVQFDQGEDMLTEISAKFTPEAGRGRALGGRLRRRGDVGGGRRRVPADAGPSVLLIARRRFSPLALAHPPRPPRGVGAASGSAVAGRRRRTSHTTSSSRSNAMAPKLRALASRDVRSVVERHHIVAGRDMDLLDEVEVVERDRLGRAAVDRDGGAPPRVPGHRTGHRCRCGSLEPDLLGLRRARDDLHRQAAAVGCRGDDGLRGLA